MKNTIILCYVLEGGMSRKNNIPELDNSTLEDLETAARAMKYREPVLG